MRATRRDVLTAVTVAAGTISAYGPEVAAQAAGTAFRQGVASGDPKPDSVILWTRAADPRSARLDLPLRLQVATSPDFSAGSLAINTVVTATRRNDGCVRVKVTGLGPHTRYWYRFGLAGGWSVVGRTRTAPRPQDVVPVRFAYASCQDYIGRYYNAYLPLLAPEQDDLDFLVHLGDFIYETTGDPSFQNGGGERSIRFEDEAGAIRLGDPAEPFFAAASLANYRQLHRTYREDALLQEVLAKFPLIAIWDDHEFTNDSWRDNATYFDGRRPAADARQTERRRNAERAWLEYMPIDDAPDRGGTRDILATGRDRLYPNTRIYRSLRYGRTLNLTLADYRTFRPDHLIPEDGFPGRVVAGEPELAAKYAELAAAGLAVDFATDRPRFEAYVPWRELDGERQAALRAAFTDEYEAAGYQGADGAAARARRSLRGLLSIDYLNARLGPAQQIVVAEAPRGLTYRMLGKQELFAAAGARFALNQTWFDLFTRFSSLRREDVYLAEQEVYLLEQLRASDAVWNVHCSSVSHTAMVVDLATSIATLPIPQDLKTLLLGLAEALGRPQILLNADQWDGFPNRRQALLDAFRKLGNVVLIAGDIHSSWVTDHTGRAGPLFEFTGTAISSATFSGLILGALPAAAAGPDQAQAKARLDQAAQAGLLDALVQVLSRFLIARRPRTRFRPDLEQELSFVDIARNGVVTVDVDGASFRPTYWLLPSGAAAESAYEDRAAALARFERRRFEVREGRLRAGLAVGR